MYFVYILRCQDGSLYTGITTDVKRRYIEHKKGIGAKYTKSHIPVSIEAVFECQNRSDASILEYRIKTLTKSQKEQLIVNEKEFVHKLKIDELKKLEVNFE